MHSRNEALERLYDEILEWGRQYDRHVARRRVDAVDPAARLFLIAEAYARTTVRVTGVNWYRIDGTLGGSGVALEEVLRCVGFTLAPRRAVRLQAGTITPTSSRLARTYTSDAFPTYPAGRDHPTPTSKEVAAALRAGFVVRELAIVRPSVILLVGAKAYRGFYREVLGRKPTPSMTSRFEALTPATPVEVYEGAVVLSWPHPSRANGRYKKWRRAAAEDLCDQPQVQALARVLHHGPGTSGP